MLKKEVVGLNEGTCLLAITMQNLGPFFCELALQLILESCYAKKKVKQLEDMHTFELLGGVHQEYETVYAQAVRFLCLQLEVFALLQCEESRRRVTKVNNSSQPPTDRSVLASNNEGSGRVRDCGCDGSHVGRTGCGGHGGPSGIDPEKLYRVHYGRIRLLNRLFLFLLAIYFVNLS